MTTTRFSSSSSSIPTSLASVYLVTILFIVCFFSFLHHLHLPRNLIDIETDRVKLIINNCTVPMTTKPVLHELNTNFTSHPTIKESEDDLEEDDDPIFTVDDLLSPPFNSSREERVAWFKEKFPISRIFRSTTRTRQFERRIQEFFGGGDPSQGNSTICMGRFYLTWISPASLLGRREMMALESVLSTHPKGCVVILSRTMDSSPGRLLLKPLTDRGFRVYPVAPDLPLLFNNTPAQAWLEGLKAGEIDPGMIPITQNLSNLLRLVVLYKYGGVYLDVDFIILKDVSRLRNSIGIQTVNEAKMTWKSLNNAVMIFDKGHPLLWKFMEEFASHFNGNVWGHNGPYLVSRVVMRVVNDERFKVTILPPMVFYPLDWVQIGGIFYRPKNEAQERWAQYMLHRMNRESYGIHLWNKISRSIRIEEGSVLGRLISDRCIRCLDIYDS